jgi:hypothetical protein
VKPGRAKSRCRLGGPQNRGSHQLICSMFELARGVAARRWNSELNDSARRSRCSITTAIDEHARCRCARTVTGPGGRNFRGAARRAARAAELRREMIDAVDVQVGTRLAAILADDPTGTGKRDSSETNDGAAIVSIQSSVRSSTKA